MMTKHKPNNDAMTVSALDKYAIIERLVRQMSPEQQEKLIKLLRVMANQK